MIALLASGVSAGDEVIMPALTFVGTANAILACGATPVLVDVDSYSANMDTSRIVEAISPRTRAIMPVHLYGLPAAMIDIVEIANAHGLNVIEDACEAIGASCEGQKVGAIGDAGVFDFYPNKALTTGEGGMIVSNDAAFLRECRAAVNQGRPGTEVTSTVGFSLRGSELAAAIGRAQLESLDRRIGERQQIAQCYIEVIATVPELQVLSASVPRSWFTFPVLLPKNVNREHVMRELATKGIESADYFPAIQTLPAYKDRVKTTGDLTVSKDLGKRVLCLPFWSGVEVHIPEIVETLTELLVTEGF